MKRKTLFSVLLVLLVVVPLTHAIGFYVPEQREVLFQPGQTIQYALGLVGPANTNLAVELTAGPLEPYVTISDSDVVLKDGEVKKIMVTIKFPQTPIDPGVYSVTVVAREMSQSSGGITARAAIRHNMLVINPGEGIFPKAQLHVRNHNFDEPTNWDVEIVNYGIQTVKDAYADFEVFDRTGKLVATGSTNHDSVRFREKVGLQTPLAVPDGTPGRHTVKATVHADSWNTVLEQDVVLGAPRIELTSYTDTLTQGQITEFQMGLQNIWEQELEGSAEVVIFAGGREIRASNPKIVLSPWKGSTHSAFINIPVDVSPGQYQGYVSLDFFDIPIEYPITVTVAAPAVEERPTPALSPNTGGFSLVPWILLLVVLALVIFFVYQRKRQKGEEDEFV